MSARTLNNKSSLSTILTELRYTLSQAQAQPLGAPFVPGLQALRDELDVLSDHAALTWVDYTAPADWAGCGRISPWHRAGRALLHRLSPRFPKTLTPAHYQALRRNRLAMHMQYLKPADRAGRYDLLAFAAAEPTLRERHPPASTSADDNTP